MTDENPLPLIDALRSDHWISVDTMPGQDRPDLYLDLVIISSSQSTRITGKEHEIDSVNETFALAFYKHKRKGYWAEDCDWKSKHLGDICGKSIIETLSDPPREIRFFTSPELQKIHADATHNFKCCAAIEFSKIIEYQRRILVVAASQAEPFLVEFSVEETASNNLLDGLILMDNVKNVAVD